MPRALAVVVLSALALTPAAEGRVKPSVAITAPASVSAGARVLVVARPVGEVRGARVELQQRRGRRWSKRAASRVRRPGRSIRLRTAAGARAGKLVLRAVLIRNRHVIATSRTRRVAVFKRGGTPGARFALPPTNVVQVPQQGQPGTVRYHGDLGVQPGDFVAAGVGPATPTGFLGKATAVAHQGTDTLVETVPATLLEAVPAGAIDVHTTATSRTAAFGPRAAGAGDKALAKSVSCSGGGSIELSGSVSLTSDLAITAHWGDFSFSHPLGRVKDASFTASATASARLGAKATASAGCKLDETKVAEWQLPTIEFTVGPIPVVIVPKASISVSAEAEVQSTVSTEVHGGFTAKAGIGYTRSNGFAPISSFTPQFGYEPPSVSSTAKANATVTPKIDLLVYDVAGPEIALAAGLSFAADMTKDPWWTLTLPIDLTAKLTVPALGLDSGELHVYQHEFELAHADSAAPTTTTPTPAEPTPPAPHPSPRHISYYSLTNDLQCSLASNEDTHEDFFSRDTDDGCGTFLAVDGTLYGPAVIPAGDQLGDYIPWTPVSQTHAGDGTAADPRTVVTTVAAGDTGVELTQTDVYQDGGTAVDTSFALSGADQDTQTVRLSYGADCYLAENDYGTGAFDAPTTSPTCQHHADDGGVASMSLSPLSAGATGGEGHYADIWADIGAQTDLPNNCSCDATHDNGFALSWPVVLSGTTPVIRKQRLAFGY